MTDLGKLIAGADTEEKIGELLKSSIETLSKSQVAFLSLRLLALMLARHERELKEMAQINRELWEMMTEILGGEKLEEVKRGS